MDQKVLDAQRWVNATYRSVAGYDECREDGKTGWDIMFSLTHALQHELGIQTLSTNFGPTTLNLLAQRGDVGPGFANTNIIRIVQHGLFCKGYWGGNTLGTFDSATVDAVKRIKSDAGVDSSNGLVWPKLFKAILTMDAYVQLSGGSGEVRSIQRWLNSKYTGKSTFFIIPCDGFYSRDVQTALMKAIQYEIGIPEGQATGNFGPATQNGLRANRVARGSSGIFVQLFSAACVFNGKVIGRDGVEYRTAFKSTFDGLLESYVSEFQAFSMLAVNGAGDFQTWAQLLVSCGDQDRSVGAGDTRFQITASRAAALRSQGYLVVGRYLDEDPDSTLDKEIKPGELDAMFAAGLRVFPISQYNARQLSDFTREHGVAHAQRAHARAAGYGFNVGTVIYFAVDYDAMDEEITSNILPYFHGVQAGLASLGKRYLAGVYGSRNVCSRVTDEAFACCSFVAGMSWGFSGNLGFPMPRNWSFTQIKELPDHQVGAGDVIDLDRVAHRSAIDPGVGRDGVGSGESPTAKYLEYIGRLYEAAQAYGSSDRNLRVLEFLRFPTYVDLYEGWKVLIGDVDRTWIDYANGYFSQRGWQVVRQFKDPSYGITLDVGHFGATANSVYLKGLDSGTSTGRGDFGGWGGDLSTFYGEWQTEFQRYASGYDFCFERLAKTSVASTFQLNDLIEDADGYLVGAALISGQRVDEVIRAHIGGNGHLSRFQRFRDQRFGGSRSGIEDVARAMLRGSHATTDPVLDVLRYSAIAKIAGWGTPAPADVPASVLDPFVRGFAQVFEDHVNQENQT